MGAFVNLNLAKTVISDCDFDERCDVEFFGGEKHHHIWKSVGLLVKLLSVEIRFETRWYNKTDKTRWHSRR